jgi:hypothetical protein
MHVLGMIGFSFLHIALEDVKLVKKTENGTVIDYKKLEEFKKIDEEEKEFWTIIVKVYNDLRLHISTRDRSMAKTLKEIDRGIIEMFGKKEEGFDWLSLIVALEILATARDENKILLSKKIHRAFNIGLKKLREKYKKEVRNSLIIAKHIRDYVETGKKINYSIRVNYKPKWAIEK